MLFRGDFFSVASCSALLGIGVDAFLTWKENNLLTEDDIASFRVLSAGTLLAQVLMFLLVAAMALGENAAVSVSAWSPVNPTSAYTLKFIDIDDNLNGICIFIAFIFGRRIATVCTRLRTMHEMRQWTDPWSYLKIASELIWLMAILSKFENWYVLSVQLFVAELAWTFSSLFSLWPLNLVARNDTVRIFSFSYLEIVLLYGWNRGHLFALGPSFSLMMFFLFFITFIDIVKLSTNHHIWTSRTMTYLWGLVRRILPFHQQRRTRRSQ